MTADKKVIIVDDDARNIFALSAVLKAKKYQCIAAENAGEALKLITERQDICIALVDMMMPDMDGYELIKKIRAETDAGSLPIIAVTAQAMVGDREKCLAAGADAYISKPVDIDKLISIMNELLNT